MERWTPLSIRGAPEGRASYDTLHDGIPEWLTSSVLGWIGTTLEFLDHQHGNRRAFFNVSSARCASQSRAGGGPGPKAQGKPSGGICRSWPPRILRRAST